MLTLTVREGIITSLLGDFGQEFVDDEGVRAVFPAFVGHQSDVLERLECAPEVSLPVFGSRDSFV